MNLPELLAILEAEGVGLSADASSGRVVVDAPRGVMTVELKAALLVHKPWLLAHLARQAPREEVGGRTSGASTHEPGRIDRPNLELCGSTFEAADPHALAGRGAAGGEGKPDAEEGDSSRGRDLSRPEGEK